MLPGSAKEEFLLMLPFVPNGRSMTTPRRPCRPATSPGTASR